MGSVRQPRLRLVAVGCGRVFERFYLPALQRSSDWILIGGVDENADRLSWLRRSARGVALVRSLGDLSDALEVDAVLISSPPDTHRALAADALRRGLHALIEKPMVVAPSESASLLALAGQAGRRVLVGFNRRFRPSYGALRERLRRLPLSRISGISGISHELRTDPSRWGAVSHGGELLDDLASHQLDLVPWLVDRPVEEVSARVERQDAGAATAAIELRLAGGMLARCRAAHGSVAAEWLELNLEDRIIIANIGGMVSAGRATAGLAHRYLAARATASSVWRRLIGAPAFTAETFVRQLEAWAAVLRGDSDGICADGAAGGRCVALVEACRQSAAARGAWIAPTSQ